MSLLPSNGNLSIQPLQRLMHRRHIGLEVYRLDFILGSGLLLSVSSPGNRFSRLFVGRAAPVGLALIPQLFTLCQS
jgi:hypothetical protein